jgi:hypothetical protein
VSTRDGTRSILGRPRPLFFEGWPHAPFLNYISWPWLYTSKPNAGQVRMIPSLFILHRPSIQTLPISKATQHLFPHNAYSIGTTHLYLGKIVRIVSFYIDLVVAQRHIYIYLLSRSGKWRLLILRYSVAYSSDLLDFWHVDPSYSGNWWYNDAQQHINNTGKLDVLSSVSRTPIHRPNGGIYRAT